MYYGHPVDNRELVSPPSELDYWQQQQQLNASQYQSMSTSPSTYDSTGSYQAFDSNIYNNNHSYDYSSTPMTATTSNMSMYSYDDPMSPSSTFSCYSSASSASFDTVSAVAYPPSGSQQRSSRSSVGSTSSSYYPPSMSPSPSSASSSSSPISPQETRYFCLAPGCDKTTKRAADLQRHMNSIHFPEAAPQFYCEWGSVCPRSHEKPFNRYDKMVDHMREVHDADIPKAYNGKRSAALQLE